jgi:low affinity Fe/Cu permease
MNRRSLIVVEIAALSIGAGIGRWLFTGGAWQLIIVAALGALLPTIVVYWFGCQLVDAEANRDMIERRLQANEARLDALKRESGI